MLSPAAAATCDAALAQLGAAADQLDRVAAASADGIAGWWAGVLGAEATVSALASNAAATRTLLDVMTRKRPTLATDAEAAAFVTAINQNTDTGLAVSVAAQLTPAGAAAEVAAGTAHDLGAAAATIGTGWLAVLKASPYLAAGFLLLVGWSWLGRKRA